MIQFARYAPYLAARGHRVSLIVIPTLVELFHSLKGIQRVIATPFKPREEKGPICWLPLMSVPHVLGLAEDDLRADVPYLAAEPARVAVWAKRLGAHGFKIGIAWQGNPKYTDDEKRSIPLAEFAPLAEIAGVRLISLQLGSGSDQIENVAFRDRIETLGEAFDAGPSSFLDTAAVMTRLDLVVISDTSIAHLAGALARPAFVALARVPDWRWLLDRDDSPWYPSLRLFRQSAPGDWPGVFARIAEAVRELAGRG